jgi:predicted lipid-binding transport protein (Tim44 family)
MRKEAKSERIELVEYWTLARSNAGSNSDSDSAGWKVVSIEQRAEGDHHLDSEIVASPWSDSRLADEALTELAVADGLPEGFTTADLAVVSFAGTAREHALDLSLADARFGPDVLEAAARQVVAAWAEAVDGDDAALEEVATPEAVTQVLYGGDTSRKTRVVVRGPRVREIKITGVDVSHEPGAMTIDVKLGGKRYVEDRDTAAVLSGSKDSAIAFTGAWTLVLDESAAGSWRLGDVQYDTSSAFDFTYVVKAPRVNYHGPPTFDREEWK